MTAGTTILGNPQSWLWVKLLCAPSVHTRSPSWDFLSMFFRSSTNHNLIVLDVYPHLPMGFPTMAFHMLSKSSINIVDLCLCEFDLFLWLFSIYGKQRKDNSAHPVGDVNSPLNIHRFRLNHLTILVENNFPFIWVLILSNQNEPLVN